MPATWKSGVSTQNSGKTTEICVKLERCCELTVTIVTGRVNTLYVNKLLCISVTSTTLDYQC